MNEGEWSEIVMIKENARCCVCDERVVVMRTRSDLFDVCGGRRVCGDDADERNLYFKVLVIFRVW